VLSVAAGNPLFVEEMVAWSSEAKDDFGAVPPTIQAVLAARLDQLDRAQRRVLETAAVEGEVFHLGSLRALAPDEPNVITSLTSLARKAFVLPEEARLSGEDAFRFRHLLIRDAAYEALPKARRAELHERLAGWLEEHSYDRFELDEIVGYHLEQAYRLHEALGSRDGQASRLAARAGELLAGAAFRAEGRFDIPAAANLLERAASMLPDEASLQVGVLCELVQSLTWKGDFSAAEDRFDEALQLARALGERGLELHCRLAGVELSYFRGGDTDSEDILRLAEEAIAVFGEDGDELGLARAWEEIAHHYGSRGQIAAHEDALRHQIVHARHEQSGRVRPQIGQLAHASVTGPTPVAEAIRRCDELAREVAGERYSEGLILRGRARLLAMLGRFDEARRQLEESKTVPDALLSPILRAANQAALGELALLAGDHAQAEAAFQSSGEICEHHRIGGGMRAISAGLLAEALYAQGRYDQAFEWTFKSEQNAHGGLNVHIAWRRTRAKLLARRGESGKGETLARELVADLSPTDWLNWRGDALLDLGEVLRLAGRSVEARKIVEEARSLYERKGNVVSAERARRVIGELVD
jgi:tetratricopeptide (TPR) repeat protein